MVFSNIKIQSSNNMLHGVLAKPETPFDRGVVFLHGGGEANTTRYEYLQNRLVEAGIASLAFDMRGCGQSEGQFSDSSLANRVLDAEQAIKVFSQETGLRTDQIFFWGSSMGAHVACRLCNALHVRGLVLQSPAAYGEAAEPLLLGPEFTAEISKPNSWSGSPAIKELSKFTGRVFVVFGKSDTVIPEEVKMLFKESIKPSDVFAVLDGGTHTLLKPSNPDERKALEQLADISISFMRDATMK